MTPAPQPETADRRSMPRLLHSDEDPSPTSVVLNSGHSASPSCIHDRTWIRSEIVRIHFLNATMSIVHFDTVFTGLVRHLKQTSTLPADKHKGAR